MQARTKLLSAVAGGLCIAVALGIALTGTSTAGKENSTVLISKRSGGHQGADGLQGRVVSKLNGCVGGRTVNLYWLGRDGSHPVGFAKTDARGRWKLDIPVVGGPHLAEVTRKQNCDRDTAKRRI